MSANSSMGLAGSLAIDTQGLDQLKLQSKQAPDKAIAGAAKQFEAMFLGMIMKSMREATPQDGLFDSEATKLYTGMLDQQFAQQMAKRGTGLADAITRQLSRGAMPAEPVAGDKGAAALQLSTMALAKLNFDTQSAAVAPSTPAAPVFDVQPQSLDAEANLDLLLQQITPSAHERSASQAATTAGAPTGGSTLAQTGGFVNRIWSHAVDAARSIGVPPQFMVGQAALESGWGKHEIRNADGSATHNLFGVKAGKGWSGPTVDKTTTEYVNGAAIKTTAKFRVYSSYGEAFKDYAKLIGGNPRYANVIAQAQDARGFASGLQRAGYATDPAYADKLVRLINGNTLRQSLAYAPPATAQLLARG
jgi:flagellar protein FlgJ